MALLDSLLNLAVLLLWVNWRSLRLEPLANPIPSTLVGTLKSTSPGRFKSWPPLISLFLLLLLRVVLCREIGSPVNWTPKLDLVFVSLAFRSDTLHTAVLYSTLSALRLIVVFYFWMLVLVAINQKNAQPDAIERLLRVHLGRVARWPRLVLILLPMAVAAVLWILAQPLLMHYSLALPAGSLARLAAQGAVISLGLFLSLKYLLPGLLLADLVLSYVYLGTNPLWDFISATSGNLLKPLRRIPLRFAKLDLAPFCGALIVVALLHWVPNLVIRELALRNLTLWPH